MAIATPEQLPAAEPSEQGLPLPSLRIRGYRLFEDLTLPRLARVNLITGKNNTGKTALLEAIRIWADAGAPATLRDILMQRGDWQVSSETSFNHHGTWADLGLVSLFGHYPTSLQEANEITISLDGDDRRSLQIEVGYLSLGNRDVSAGSEFSPIGDKNAKPGQTIGIRITSGKLTLNYHLPASIRNAPKVDEPLFGTTYLVSNRYVSSCGLSAKDVAMMWDAISLTIDEDEVLHFVKLLTPKLERTNLRATDYGQGRLPFARVEGIPHPIPLARLGDGVSRAFGIGLALVNAQNGCLLLDEVENGIHYSVQPELWRMIFATARRLNVQVFATTHSYDCIRGFQQAASENKEVEGKLIRLTAHKGEIIPTEFDEHGLEIIVEEQLEVR